GGGLVYVEERNFCAGRGKRPGGRASDRAASAGDGYDLARQRFFRLFSELGLLQRPVFDVEHVSFGNRLEASNRFRVCDGFDCGFSQIGGDARILLAAAEAKQSESGHEYDPGEGIEHALGAVAARVVALEVGAIAGRELGNRGPHTLPEVVFLTVL